MWLLGLPALAIGVGLFIASRNRAAKLALVRDTETSTVAHLKQLAESMREGLAAGNLRYITEVQGDVRADEPLVAELTGQPCVHVNTRISREYEETVWERKPDGSEKRTTRKRRDVLKRETRSIPFLVADATGAIAVDPTDAEITAEKVLSELRSDPGAYGDREADDARGRAGGRRTLGYRFEEEAIAVGQAVYVLGEVNDRHGELRVEAPEEGRFIVTVHGERQLCRQLEKTIRALRIAATISAAIGVLLLLI